VSACPLLLFISGATTVVFCKIQIKTKSKIQKSIPIGTQPDHKELAPNQLHWQDQSPHVQSLGWLGKTIHGLVIHSPKNTSSFIKMLNIFTFQSRCLRHLDSPFFFPMDLDAYWILSVFQLRKTLAGHTHTQFLFPIGVQRNQSTSVRLRPTWIVVKRLKRKGHDTEWRFFRLITLHVKRTIVLEHPAVGTIGSTSKTLDYQAKGIQTMVDWIGANLGGMARRFKSENFFCLQAARVRLPGRSPFSLLILHETDKSNVVRKTKTKGQTNERISHTNSKQINPRRSSGSKTRGAFRSQVIDGAQEEEADRRRALIRFEIPVTRLRIRS